jgi:hypothetical protein
MDEADDGEDSSSLVMEELAAKLTPADLQLLEQVGSSLDRELYDKVASTLARSQGQVLKHERRTQQYNEGRVVVVCLLPRLFSSSTLCRGAQAGLCIGLFAGEQASD